MTPERTDAERAASDRRRLGQLVGLGLVTVAVVAVWILSLTGGAGAPRPTGGSAEVYPPAAVPAAREPSLTRAASAAGCSLRTFPSFGDGATGGRVHYRTNPPTSGPSNPQPAADGIYDTPASTEKLVRALAGGRVVIQFLTGASERLRGQLKTLVNEDPRHTILTANQTGMPFAVAATAWRHYVGCNSAGPAMFDALRDFRTAFRDRAR
jgi:hypothetical protein